VPGHAVVGFSADGGRAGADVQWKPERGPAMHVLLLLLILLPAPRPSLHKCLGADGVASYQSLPCGPGQRTAWTRAAPPPAAPAPAPALPPADAPSRRQAAAPVPRSPARPAIDRAASRCASVRRAADLTRDRLWNRLSFRQRSELDAKVAQACARR
jgi:hypothetical protein